MHSRMYIELQQRIVDNHFDRFVTNAIAIITAGIITYIMYEIVKVL